MRAIVFPLTPNAAQAAIVSSGGLADLTLAQQGLITEGILVTTIDGKRWQYKGTGEKTSETNFILISDETPDWASIENKPDLPFQSSVPATPTDFSMFPGGSAPASGLHLAATATHIFFYKGGSTAWLRSPLGLWT